MPFGNTSPIFIRPAFPSINSTPSTSNYSTPATTPPSSPLPAETSKFTDLTTSALSTSKHPKSKNPLVRLARAEEQQEECRPTSCITTPPWYTLHQRTPVPRLYVRIPDSNLSSRNLRYLSTHRETHGPALQLLSNASPYPRAAPPFLMELPIREK
jgi:hypothetical protein